MKVLVAPDKFKGSLTAAQVADSIAAGFEHDSAIRCTRLPLADGGDGSVAAAIAAGYQPHTVHVAGGLGFAAFLLGAGIRSGAEFFLDLLDFDATSSMPML